MNIGFDIGGTKIEVCVLDENGHSVFQKRMPTPSSYAPFLDVIQTLVNDAESETQQVFEAIGIGLPGSISPVTGLMRNANCTFINGHDLIADLKARLNKNVFVANDANCFALSEAIDGSAESGKLVFGAILGTGCGGGVVFDKQLWNGPSALSGEWGHNPLPGYDKAVDGEPRRCYCGRDNCLEQFISGTGLEITYQKISGQKVNAKEIIERKRKGEADATATYTLLVDQIARSFSSLINIFDPDIITIGGGLSNVEELYDDVAKATQPYVFGELFNTRLVPAKYGDSSGIRGAARLVQS